MNINIELKPGSSVAKVELGPNETITSEGGAMVAMSGNLRIETTTHKKNSGGSLLKSMKRMLAGESLFFNHFTADAQGGTIYLGTSLPGDMEVFNIEGKKLYVQAGSFVASTNDVQMDTSWQGAKNFLSGESLFWIVLSGSGQAVLNAFGVIYPVDIDGEYIVDTGHIVAYEEGLQFSISKAGESWMSSFLGGEGFVCRFKGKGRIWCQSHSSNSWGQAMSPHLTSTK